MGMFDYRRYSVTESAELANTTLQLATFGQLDRIFGLPVAQLANTFGNILPPGATANPIHVALPAGWSDVGPAALGMGPDSVDSDGYYIIESPLTGRTFSGPQAKIYEERDTSGHVTRLSVTFAGTNSPVDLLDYTQLNSGEIAPYMEQLLTAVRDYALRNGLTADDVIVTGYSLGAAYTNIMAKYADTLAGGFFADSSYVAHAVPYTYEGQDRVLNIGFENDIVHRAAGDFDSLGEAVDAAPGLIGQDYALQSSTDISSCSATTMPTRHGPMAPLRCTIFRAAGRRMSRVSPRTRSRGSPSRHSTILPRATAWSSSLISPPPRATSPGSRIWHARPTGMAMSATPPS